MSGIRSAEDLDLCDFVPGDGKRPVWVTPCIKERDHQGDHYVSDSSFGSVTIYRVDPDTNGLESVVHTDIRGTMTREEIAAIYAWMLESARSKGESDARRS